MPRKLSPDMWLFGAMIVLLSIGVVMVYSASAIMATDRFHDPYFFLKKQLVWALLGSLGLLVALRMDYRRLERLQWPILLGAALLLVLVLVPPFAQPINGTRRWLRLGPVSFQPAYLALGITLLIATQVVVNVGVVTGSLPTKGLPLPFISFGGSALLVTMLSTGVLLNISQHANV